MFEKSLKSLEFCVAVDNVAMLWSTSTMLIAMLSVRFCCYRGVANEHVSKYR